jgi:DNA-binding NarL/FixJ family response regulator
MKQKIAVGLVDDDTLIISLLTSFLNEHADLEVCFSCEGETSLKKALEEASCIPDVLVLDLKMKSSNGVDVAAFLKTNYPDIQIIIMSSFYKRSFTGFMVKTGISAFIPKGVLPQELVEVIKEVHTKGYYFRPDQMDVLRDQISAKAPMPALKEDDVLTERELEVLHLICQQKTAKEIGEKLFITNRTVEGHKNNLFIKTGTKNIAGLVIYAVQNNYIKAEDIVLV